MLKRQIKEIIRNIKNYFTRLNNKINKKDDSKINSVKNAFIKIKNNLVLTNMLLVFGVITLSFISIFIFMQQTLRSDSEANMKSIIYKNSIISQKYDTQLINNDVQKESDNIQKDDEEIEDDESGYIYVTYSTWDETITHKDVRYVIKSEELIDSFHKLVEGTTTGLVEKDGIDYRYYISKNIFPVGTYKIVFYNLTSENRFLKYLAVALILIDLILSIISYYLSLFITNRSLTPIRESIEKQKQFTENASHELRTPLTVIKTNMEVLKSDMSLTIKDQEKWINYIDEEVTRMSDLARDLLVLARLDSNTNNEEFEDLNLTEELFKIEEAYSRYLKNKNIELITNIDKNVVFNCQPNKIKELINIFLENAIKYNKPNGFIKISLKKYKTKFNLIFEDSGIGIKKEDQKKIFDRFYRGDSSRSTEGTGLGLSIAQGIIEKHNGNIKIISKENEGTKFTISFPYYGEL